MSELYNIFEGIGYPCSPDYLATTPEKNTLTITLQEGPIKEVGSNGCQIDHAIWALAHILRSFNKRFPCRENSCAITHLDEAMMWLEKRRADRENRGVEGKNEE